MIVHRVEVGKKGSSKATKRDHKRIYVGCAEADIRYRDMLVNGRHRWELYTNPTIEFLTCDRQKELELAHYKSLVEAKIRKADGVMIIVTRQTQKDPLVLWEIDCTLSHNIPVVGIDIDKNHKDKTPKKLTGKMTTYGWEWFAEFINGL